MGDVETTSLTVDVDNEIARRWLLCLEDIAAIKEDIGQEPKQRFKDCYWGDKYDHTCFHKDFMVLVDITRFAVGADDDGKRLLDDIKRWDHAMQQTARRKLTPSDQDRELVDLLLNKGMDLFRDYEEKLRKYHLIHPPERKS